MRERGLTRETEMKYDVEIGITNSMYKIYQIYDGRIAICIIITIKISLKFIFGNRRDT